MYGYEAFIEITAEQLLQKISQEQIFEFVLEEPFSYGFRYLSPFRPKEKPDTKAGCRFESREDGTILFVDFGERYLTGRTHRTCFRAVMDKHKCDLTASIKILCAHFNLSTSQSDYEPVRAIEYTKKDTEQRADITWTAKPFNRFDTQFWSQFLIKTEHLTQDNVFSVNRYIVNSPVKGLKIFTPYKHCYAIDFAPRVKLYQPYQDEFRWITNCDENNIGNADYIVANGEELIVQKSYKDHRVIRNTLPELDRHVIWFQNEGCVPSEEICRMFIARFKLITFFYDNDEDGIVAALKLTEYFNSLKPSSARMVYIPDDIPWKDPGEFIKKEGRKDLIEILKYIGICKTLT